MIRQWLRGDIRPLFTLARKQLFDAIETTSLPAGHGQIARVLFSPAGIVDSSLIVEVATPRASIPHHTVLDAKPRTCLSPNPLGHWPTAKKAIFDKVVAATLLITGLLLMAVIAAIVKLDSPGPIVFRQMREGLNGKLFTVLKFRTMYHHGTHDESRQATRRDPRITRSGHWLRRFSLDELPQLWNVLRGDMSLVGPRPHLPTTRAGNRLFSEIVPDYQARHRVKPGLTGWAQVQGLRGETRTEQDIVDRVEQDIYYIEHWSLALDLEILLRTFVQELLMSRSGRAY